MVNPVTPTEVELTVGQKWKDNDPRHQRELTVIGWRDGVTGVQVQVESPTRKTWVALSRFNGRRNGYSLVK
jgi:hypothetical protein